MDVVSMFNMDINSGLYSLQSVAMSNMEHDMMKVMNQIISDSKTPTKIYVSKKIHDLLLIKYIILCIPYNQFIMNFGNRSIPISYLDRLERYDYRIQVKNE